MNATGQSGALPLEGLAIPHSSLFWPLAPVWWIGIIAILILIALMFLHIKRKHNKRLQFKALALNELSNYELPINKPAEQWLQQINMLLKRIAVQNYPKEDSHQLSGNQWLVFLNSKNPASNIEQCKELVDGLYQRNYHLDENALNKINQSVKMWIKNHV